MQSNLVTIISNRRLIALNPQPQHVDSRWSQAFDAIPKDSPAKRAIQYKAAVRGGFAPDPSRAKKPSPRRLRQVHRNDHSTSCQSKCFHRKPHRTPRHQRLRFTNTRWIQSRISCADASDQCGRIRNEEKRIHASGHGRGASNPKPSLDMPDRNCRIIGTLLPVRTPQPPRRSSAGSRGCARPAAASIARRILCTSI